MDWSNQITRIRRFLRDPSGRVWSDELIRRSYNEEQYNLINATGKLEDVKVVAVPCQFQSAFQYDFEWPYTDYDNGEPYRFDYLHDSTQKVFTSKWEAEHLNDLTPTTSITAHNYTQPWEPHITGVTNAADPPPLLLPDNFFRMLYIAHDRDPLEPLTRKQVENQDQSYKVRQGDPIGYWIDQKESNRFYLYPTPSTVTWQTLTRDFSGYTETDTNNRLSKSGQEITITAMPKNEDAYIYKDFGAGNFSYDIKHGFIVRANTGTADAGTFAAWMLTNDIDDAYALGNGNKNCMMVIVQYSTVTGLSIGFYEYPGGISKVKTGLSLDTDYYCELTGSSGSNNNNGFMTLDIYQETIGYQKIPIGSQVLPTGSWGLVTSQVTELGKNQSHFRYFFPVSSYNISAAAAITGKVSHLLRLVYLDTEYGAADPDTAQYSSTTLDIDNNVLVVFEKNPTEIKNKTDESDLIIPIRKCVEYGTVAKCYRTNTDGRIPSLAEYWEMRREVAYRMIKEFKSRRMSDRTYCLETKTIRGRRKHRHPRLPDEYPATYP